MQKSNVDKENNQDILGVEEVAEYLRKSTSWVYKNWQDIRRQEARGFLIVSKKGGAL